MAILGAQGTQQALQSKSTREPSREALPRGGELPWHPASDSLGVRLGDSRSGCNDREGPHEFCSVTQGVMKGVLHAIPMLPGKRKALNVVSTSTNTF